ncbi:nicotinate-nucleotide adenylyltransferase [Pseudochelatococcus lubricantis]|uniref:nicotinate-nucleotide adenylyltransferase n=1 Tax=Pseudochelatococcus lubricantis TaxID=1538102 RepID=UPI0035EC9A81
MTVLRNLPKRHSPSLPPHAPGLRIGLFGGSFNPPHAGHRLASLVALKHLRLDRVWWIVTPGNPLKDNTALPPLAERMAAARALTRHARIDITGFEAEIETQFTYDTIAWLTRRCPQVDFVWIMGADNLAGFHRWQRWRDIARLVPLAIIDRPGSTLKAARSRAAIALARYRFAEKDAGLLSRGDVPGWVFLHGPRSPLSSTMLRAAGNTIAAP